MHTTLHTMPCHSDEKKSTLSTTTTLPHSLMNCLSLRRIVLIFISLLVSFSSSLVPSESQLFNRPVLKMGNLKNFFRLPLFAVVGASNNRDKFGNKVLRCYQKYSKNVVPINKLSSEVEGIACVNSLTTLSDRIQAAQESLADHSIQEAYKNIRVCDVGVSIITPPAVTKDVLEEGMQLGFRNFFLQPGTVDDIVQTYITAQCKLHCDLNIIEDCVLVQLPQQE